MLVAELIPYNNFFILGEIKTAFTRKENETEIYQPIVTIINSILKYNYKIVLVNKQYTITDLSSLSLLYEKDKQYYPVTYYDKGYKRIITGIDEYSEKEFKRYTLDKYIFVTESVYQELLYKKFDIDLNSIYVDIFSYIVESFYQDDTVSEEEYFFRYKEYGKNIVSKKLSRCIPTTIFYEYFFFTKINNKLKEKGIFLTEKNKDEIEPLLDNDDKIILSIFEKFKQYINAYNQYIDYSASINKAETKEEIDSILSEINFSL